MIYDILDNYIGVPRYHHCLSLYWVIDPIESKYATTVIWTAMFFFLRVIFQCLYTVPQPKKNPEGPTTQAWNPINWKPQPQNPIQDPNTKTQTPTHSGKNIAFPSPPLSTHVQFNCANMIMAIWPYTRYLGYCLESHWYLMRSWVKSLVVPSKLCIIYNG